VSPVAVTRAAQAGAVVAGALTACLVYALDRTAAALAGAQFDPLAVVASARIDYFWRMALSTFVGTLVGFGWPRLVGERSPAALRGLLRGVWPVLGLCATLSVLFP
jgi:hypothetical protein